MRFSLLLLGLHVLLKRASVKNSSFKHYIRKSKAKILIKTVDGKKARLFIFEKGNVSSLKGDTNNFDAALVWKNARDGYEVMTNGNPGATFDAASEGKLLVEGMIVYAQWFEGAIKLVL